MSMKAEIEVMLLQVKTRLLPESQRLCERHGEQVVLTAVSRNQAADTWSWTSHLPGLGHSKSLLLSTWILVLAAAPENSSGLGRVFETFGPSIGLQC